MPCAPFRGGRREITVRTARTARGSVTVTVSDTGRGISDAVARRLFEPLFTTKKGGLGMGLAICRTVVEAHGGRLWAERSRRGRRGATLCIRLPLATGAGPASGQALGRRAR